MTQRLSRVFWDIYDAAARHPRVISHRGGTRSGKTYSALQFLAILVSKCDKGGDVTSVVSETLPHLKKGAIRDFERIIGRSLKSDSRWNASNLVYTFPSGGMLEFFSADSPDKVMGPARKRLFVNECNHISYDTYRQLAVRTTGLILLDYNPAAAFWAMDKVETRESTVCLHSTYLDNPFLTPEQIAEIESNKADANWWKVYGLGEVGSLEGVVYEFDTVDEMPEPGSMTETWGIDFGFTNSITAIVHCLIDTGRKEIWLDERMYRKGMLNSDIAQFLKSEGVPRTVTVYADSAEPKSITELCSYGLNVRGCDKTSASDRHNPITAQINFLRGFKIHVTKRSLNLIDELRKYVWDTDRNGERLNVPVKVHDHCFVGDTEITTSRGRVRIKDIRQRDMVLTSKGYKRVNAIHDNGVRYVVDFKLHTEEGVVVLSATPDHLIKTTKAWKKISELRKGDRIFLVRPSMVKSTEGTKVKSISATVATECTETSGLSTTVLFQKVMRFITSILIRLTTLSRILFAYRSRNTGGCIGNGAGPLASMRGNVSIWTKSVPSLPGGTDRRKGGSGTANMLGSHSPGVSRRPIRARCAARISRANYTTVFSAQMPASPDGEEKRVWTTLSASVQNAEGSLRPTGIQKPDAVQAVVLLGIDGENGRRERVFDISVEGVHEYCANGVIVHNCMDAFRYGCYAPLSRFNSGQYVISTLRH